MRINSEWSTGPSDEAENPSTLHGGAARFAKEIPRRHQLPDVEVDHAFIQNVASERDATLRVAHYHQRRFDAEHAHVRSHIDHMLVVGEHYSERIGRQIKETARQLKNTPIRLTTTLHELGPPWSRYELIRTVVLFLLSLGLLAIGVNTLATYLLNSGFVAVVERPVLAYVLCGLAIGVPLSLELRAHTMQDLERRERFVGCLQAMAIACSVVWILTFALIMGELQTPTVDELIAGQGVALGAATYLDPIYVSAQLLAEVLISASLWIHIDDTVRRHGSTFVRRRNREHRDLSRTHNGLVRLLGDHQNRIAELRGLAASIDAMEDAFVAKAASILSGLQLTQQRRSRGVTS